MVVKKQVKPIKKIKNRITKYSKQYFQHYGIFSISKWNFRQK